MMEMRNTLGQIQSTGDGISNRTNYMENVLGYEDKIKEFDHSVKTNEIFLN